MAIWSAEIKELERLYESFKGQFPEMEKELGQLIHFDDPNVILLYSRRCLEVIITELCECELKRERGTEPLKSIIDKLNKEKKIPGHIASSMYGLNELSTYGTHPKDFDPEQVKPVLVNLDIIIKWYLKYKESKIKKPIERNDLVREDSAEVAKKASIKQRKKPVKFYWNKILSGVLIIAILSIAAILVYPNFFKKDNLEYLRSKGKISVVVLPFRNMTSESGYDHLGDWIQENLINYLSLFSDALKVKQFESTNSIIQSERISDYSSINTSVAGNLSRKLDADIFIIGSVRISGPDVRLSAQITDTQTKEVIKAFEEGPVSENKIDSLINLLRTGLTDFLILTLKQEELPDVQQGLISTNSPEAYDLYMLGKDAFFRSDYADAQEKLTASIKIDPDFAFAAILLSWAYMNTGDYINGKEIHNKIYFKKDSFPAIVKTKILFQHALTYEGPSACIKYLKQLQDYDDKDPFNFSDLGLIYVRLNQYDKAVSEYKKAFEIYNNWNLKQSWIQQYLNYGTALHETGRLRKEKKLYRLAGTRFPDHPYLIYRQAVRALSGNKIRLSSEYLEKYKSILKNNSVSESDIFTNLASIYWEAGLLDQAEEYFRNALSYDPESPDYLYNLAWFLVDTDRNINEGLDLVTRALETDPDNYNYLETKGWKLYRQGKFKEALEVLQLSWDLRIKYSIYNHPAYLRLEEAKIAVKEQSSI